MTWHFSTRFTKRRDKLPRPVREKLSERLRIFATDPFHPLLNNHSVEKRFPGCRSISVTGDYRAILEERGAMIVFVNIGTHSELYS
jgi:mRNA-degrading endonuclease YafQ of YafQ-DinJ toxin-antitoxin module